MTTSHGDRTTAEAIDAHMVRLQAREQRRGYMGMSFIGNPCDRYLWLMYRWMDGPVEEGRLVRIFKRGDLEEIIMSTYLDAVGVKLSHTSNPALGDEGQLEVVDGLCKGHIDGLIEGGVREYPDEPMIWENKTSNRKAFADLEKNRVKATHPEHYTQMQCYMKKARELTGLDIRRAFYTATCKDDDRIYTEFVPYDEEFATRKLERANLIGVQNSIPPRLSDDATDFRCRMCRFYWFCHEGKMTKEVNCRTCTYSTARADGTWICEKANRALPEERQRKALDCHIFLPDLQPSWKWHRAESNARNFLYELPNGGTFWNGMDSWLSRDIAEGKKDREVRLLETFRGTMEHV